MEPGWAWVINPILLDERNYITVECCPADDKDRGYVFRRNEKGQVVRGSAFDNKVSEGHYSKWVMQFIKEWEKKNADK